MMRYKKSRDLKVGDQVIKVWINTISVIYVESVNVHPAGRMMDITYSDGTYTKESTTGSEGYIELNPSLFGIMKLYIDINYFRDYYRNMFNDMKLLMEDENE